MVASCFDKCMDRRYKDGELNVGENSCIDRCSQKYWQVRSARGGGAGGSDLGASCALAWGRCLTSNERVLWRT